MAQAREGTTTAAAMAVQAKLCLLPARLVLLGATAACFSTCTLREHVQHLPAVPKAIFRTKTRRRCAAKRGTFATCVARSDAQHEEHVHVNPQTIIFEALFVSFFEWGEEGGGDRKTGDLLLCGCGRGCASLPSISASIAHPLAHSRGGGIDTFVLDIDAFSLFLAWWIRWSLVASIVGRSSSRGRRVDRVGAPPSFAWKGVHPFR
eukprot:scaffold271_cov336-Pavlova_lutheri.AAC.38